MPKMDSVWTDLRIAAVNMEKQSQTYYSLWALPSSKWTIKILFLCANLFQILIFYYYVFSSLHWRKLIKNNLKALHVKAPTIDEKSIEQLCVLLKTHHFLTYPKNSRRNYTWEEQRESTCAQTRTCIPHRGAKSELFIWIKIMRSGSILKFVSANFTWGIYFCSVEDMVSLCL